MRSYVKIKPQRNAEITLSFPDIGQSCPSLEFLTSQICYLTLFAKIYKFTVYMIFLLDHLTKMATMPIYSKTKYMYV